MSKPEPVSVPSLKVTPLSLPGLTLLVPKRHGDARGYFSETYNRRTFESAGLNADFVQDNQSLSAQAGTLRGLHFQIPPFAQIKLIRVLRGAIWDVCVDIRHGSPTFGQQVGVTLSAQNGHQLWVPEGFAHGFCTLESDTEVLYKVSQYYAPDHDKGLAWDDPALGIDWPLQNGVTPVLSDKDQAHPPLSALPTFFEYSPKDQ
ncbi:MAG: dTDP-4-dehydrorhamnose 3,5-epimerase [Robiginitomaculum sp.]|nr:dTDP-4-dehydrorhamnose 3,5-epimerase [Robiginitomaculum sp.]MDQ7078961.1 dTDP-4-dehydrorhamnose 3,5-epimerase [Robiginitomaculum sp.]